MPAASAEKRACQRANKLLQMGIKTTTISDIQPPAATDKITSEPLSTDYSTSFAMFISQAELSDIFFFFEAVGSSQESINLKIFWGRAFAEGKKVGKEEEYNRGYNSGYNEGYSDACEKDYEAGLTAASVSTTEIGTQITIDTPITVLSDQIIQTNSEPLPTAPALPDTTNSMVQTFPSSSASISTQMEPVLEPPIPATVALAPFSWADDVALLPTQVLPSSRPPRDLSGLRSLTSNPFSSLQRRSKHQKNCRSRRRRSPSNFVFLPSHISFKSQFSSSSILDWESNPSLADLSHALKALGWIRAPYTLL